MLHPADEHIGAEFGTLGVPYACFTTATYVRFCNARHDGHMTGRWRGRALCLAVGINNARWDTTHDMTYVAIKMARMGIYQYRLQNDTMIA